MPAGQEMGTEIAIEALGDLQCKLRCLLASASGQVGCLNTVRRRKLRVPVIEIFHSFITSQPSGLHLITPAGLWRSSLRCQRCLRGSSSRTFCLQAGINIGPKAGAYSGGSLKLIHAPVGGACPHILAVHT